MPCDSAEDALMILIKQMAVGRSSPLSVPEMKALAAVAKGMLKFESENELEPIPKQFLHLFVSEAEHYFREATLSIP